MFIKSNLPSEGFPKERHIRQRQEFVHMMKKGVRVVTPFFVLIGSSGQGPSRLGLTVSRKVGNAVVRNRVKRQLREIFRKTHLPEGLDLVVIGRAKVVDQDYSAIERVFLEGVDRLIHRIRR